MSGVKRAARLLEVAVIFTFVLIVLAVLLPTFVHVKSTPRETEVKENLHNIQVSIEKFAVDHNGVYPAYMTGGGGRWSAMVDVNSKGDSFKSTQQCPDIKQLADPLLREGYIDEYPRNPFVRNGVTVHQAQITMPLNAPGGDPLRNGVETGRLYGTRFGAYCTSMGQLLGAKYYGCPVASVLPGGKTNSAGLGTLNITGRTVVPIPGLPPGADVTYPCWDIWKSNKARNPLPGQFIYAGTGPVISFSNASANGQSTGLPVEIDDYILAAFGGPRTKGKDIMDNTGNPFLFKPNHSPLPPDGVSMQYGNPNGTPDGVILMLHFMEDIQYDNRSKASK